MNKIFEALANDISNLPSWMVVLLLLLALLLYFFKDSLSTRLKKQNKKVLKIEKLEHHRFFNTCDRVEYDISKMEFNTNGVADKAKSRMMHELITIKCDTMKREFKSLLLTRGIDSWGSYELQHEFKTTLGGVVEQYNKTVYDKFLQWGVTPEDATYLIDSYEDYRSCMVEGFAASIDSILMNPDYSNNFDKVNTLMELCSLAIFVIPRDVQSVFEQVNGRFEKYNNGFKVLN